MPDPDKQVQSLIAALRRANVKGDCSACGHNDWLPFHGIVRIPEAHNEPHGMAALALACDHCGHVRFHIAQALDKYIDPRGA